MSKLEDRLPDLYNELHAHGAFKGDSWERYHCDLITFFNRCGVPYGEGETVLDFGCGPKGGLAGNTLKGYDVVPYDPFVPQYRDLDPWTGKVTTFFSCDVMEHLPLNQLAHLMRRLCKHQSLQRLFISVTARAANKHFSNGLNVHLTVQPPEWWRGFFEGTLGAHYDLKLAEVCLLDQECRFGLVRTGQPYER